MACSSLHIGLIYYSLGSQLQNYAKANYQCKEINGMLATSMAHFINDPNIVYNLL